MSEDKKRWVKYIGIYICIEILWAWIIFTPIRDNTEGIFALTSDAVYYIEIADKLYTSDNIWNDIYTHKIVTKSLYPFIFYLFYRVFSNTEYYYIQLGYLAFVFILKIFVILLFRNILTDNGYYQEQPFFKTNTPKGFIVFIMLYIFNYTVFGSYVMLLWSNTFFMGLTFFILYLFYHYVASKKNIYLWLSIILSFFSTLFRVEGVITVVCIYIYTIIVKTFNKVKFTISFIIISLPFIFFHSTILYFGYKGGYTQELVFVSFNPIATIYAIYRFLFRINYEIFFNDFLKNYSVLIKLISYVIAFLFSGIIFYGAVKVARTIKRLSFGYLKKHLYLFFLLMYIFFLCLFFIHTLPRKYKNIEDIITAGFYDGRLFIFVFPILCFFIVVAIQHLFRFGLKKVATILLGIYLCLNISLAVKNKIAYLKNKRKNGAILSFGINNLKIGCIIEKQTKAPGSLLEEAIIWKRGHISYILFRKVCEYNYDTSNLSKYDYIIDFTQRASLQNFEKIYQAYAYQNNFIVLRNLAATHPF